MSYGSVIIVYLLISLSIILSGLWVFSSKREHLLSALLSLEFMVLGVFMLLFVGSFYSWSFFSLIYLIFTACEGALGLSILVLCTRSYGGDYFKSFSILY